LQILTVVSADFQENAYLVRPDQGSDCVVIDPGFEPEKIEDLLNRRGWIPRAILNTHGHADHIAGNAALKQRWPDCPLVIGTDDAPKLTHPFQNLSGPFGLSLVSPPADVEVNDGEVYSAASLEFEVLAVPGHSKGHVVYLWRGGSPFVAFVGDVIFAGSVGRTDFPDGDFDALARGIHGKLFTLPDDTVLYSGHGPATTVGREKRENPFVGQGLRGIGF
jgi:glyoxylase-like metal-dependent hydrolase (beta-lactamase superfamily II)